MKSINAKGTHGLNIGAIVLATDNSGAKRAKIVSVKKSRAKKGKQTSAKIADWVKVSAKRGIPDVEGKVFDAVIVRQKKPYRRLTGERFAFEDNAVVILKDEKGNPKGTQIKGAITKEVQERWPSVAKIGSIVY